MDSEGEAFHSMVVDISDSSSDFPSLLLPVLPGFAFLMLGRLATGKDEVFTTVGLLGFRSSTTSVWKKTPPAGAEAE